MLAQVALPLAIPINNPFPVTLAIGAIGIVAFGAELALAKRSGQGRPRLAALLVGCLIVAAALAVVGAYFMASGPADAEPILHLSGAHNPYYDFYLAVWEVNFIIALLIAVSAVTVGAILLNRRRRRPVSAPA